VIISPISRSWSSWSRSGRAIVLGSGSAISVGSVWIAPGSASSTGTRSRSYRQAGIAKGQVLCPLTYRRLVSPWLWQAMIGLGIVQVDLPLVARIATACQARDRSAERTPAREPIAWNARARARARASLGTPRAGNAGLPRSTTAPARAPAG